MSHENQRCVHQGHQLRQVQAETGPGPDGRLTIPNALARQSDALAQLHTAINKLEDKLRLVLDAPLPAPPPPGAVAAAPEPDMVFERVDLYTRGICVAVMRLDEIINRAQL